LGELMRILARVIIFVLLTALTQIGGIVYLLALGFSRLFRRSASRTTFLIFIPIYISGTLVTAHIAPIFGRVPLSCSAAGDTAIYVRSPLTCVLNRNYVTPHMREAATALSTHIAQVFPGTTTVALDANFPFIDGFPLLPHLSHDDGRKLDIAYYYQDRGTFVSGLTRSPIGYFAFEQPRAGDPLPCAGRSDWLTFRWDLNFLQPLFPHYNIDPDRMKEALRWLANEGDIFGVEKIFVEPHIAARLGFQHKRLRFQGCRAARHDDHIHFQIR
jgi:hypothetical protein